MNCTDWIDTTYGSCIDVDLVYRDESGDAEDVSSDEFAIFECAPANLKDAYVLTKTDAENGTVHLHLGEDDALGLGIGRVNWFRVARTSPDGCIDTTEQIWIATR